MKKKLLWIPALLLLGLLAHCLWPETPRQIDPPYTLSPIHAADMDILLGSDSASLEAWLEHKGFSGRFPTGAAMTSRFAEPLLQSGYPIPLDKDEEFSLSWYVGVRHDFTFLDGELQYRFQITQEEPTFRLPLFVIATHQIGGREVPFYRGNGCIVGEFTVNGYLVRITVRGYTDPGDVSFGCISWQEPLQT